MASPGLRDLHYRLLDEGARDRVVRALIASPLPWVIDEICSLLQQVAQSNVPFGLPKMELKVRTTDNV